MYANLFFRQFSLGNDSYTIKEELLGIFFFSLNYSLVEYLLPHCYKTKKDNYTYICTQAKIMRLPRINKRMRVNQTIHIYELEPMNPKFKKRHNILKEIKKKNIY